MYLSSFLEISTLSFTYCNHIGLEYLVDEQAGFCYTTSLVMLSTSRKGTSEVTNIVPSSDAPKVNCLYFVNPDVPSKPHLQWSVLIFCSGSGRL